MVKIPNLAFAELLLLPSRANLYLVLEFTAGPWDSPFIRYTELSCKNVFLEKD